MNVEWSWPGKTDTLGEQDVPVLRNTLLMPHGQAWDLTVASAVKGGVLRSQPLTNSQLKLSR